MGSLSTLYNFGFLSVNNNRGGGIWTGYNNTLANFGQLNLQNNNATVAGGIGLTDGSSFVCEGQLRVIGNTAINTGGGIVVGFDAFVILHHSTEI